ncbi:uncharacterized protein LOC119446081 [Dermacentor silvarum]|uniref:uncharacterized protein LOC119446081 n=1 Tax=Dermacentor silvarum TaxID=543639 RepID=UPI0021017194|nr:uncharacterized protein LOC119446081 [Dermacentor silvarum]
MEAEKTVCGWPTCGQPLQARPGARFAKCDACCHINCLRCKAAHEGMNCAEFQAQQGPSVKSPVRPPNSTGDGKNFDTWSPAARGRSSKGDPALLKDSPPSAAAASAATLQRPPSVNASASSSSTCSPRSADVKRQSTSPSKPVKADLETRPGDLGITHQQRKAICRTENCGYEDHVNEGDTELFCYKCRKTTCLKCNAVHGYLTCEEYRRQLEDEEDEIQVQCAGAGCEFTAFVGVSTQQLKCQLCESITCLKCCAVHEFRTCEAYEKERRRSRGAQREATAATIDEPSETTPEKPNAGASWGDDTESRDRSPAGVAASKTVMDREAPIQKEVLAQQAVNSTSNGRTGTKSHRNETVPKQSQPGHIARPETARAPPEVLMLECCACAAESPYEEIVEVAPCGHFLCRECVHTTGVGSLTYIVRCPVVTEEGISCDSYIQESALRSVMTEGEYALHKELLPLPILRCPIESCSGKFSVRPGSQSLICPSCRSEYCVTCSANHPGRTCEQFIRSVVDDGGALDGGQANESVRRGSASSESLPEDAGMECGVCMADTPLEQMINAELCGHFICRDCVCRMAVDADCMRCPVKLEDGTPCGCRVQEPELVPLALTTRLEGRQRLLQDLMAPPRYIEIRDPNSSLSRVVHEKPSAAS